MVSLSLLCLNNILTARAHTVQDLNMSPLVGGDKVYVSDRSRGEDDLQETNVAVLAAGLFTLTSLDMMLVII